MSMADCEAVPSMALIDWTAVVSMSMVASGNDASPILNLRKAGNKCWRKLLLGRKRNLKMSAEFEQSKFQEFALAKKVR